MDGPTNLDKIKNLHVEIHSETVVWGLTSQEGELTTTVVSWNIAKGHEPWRQLLQMGADVALLQEVGSVPLDVAEKVKTGGVC